MADRTLGSRAVDRLTYIAVRVAICVVQALPRPFLERQARSWSDFLANRAKIRRTVVRDNLRQAFPDWTDEQCRDTARAMWEHLLLMVVEIAHAPRVIRKTTWRRHLRIEGMEAFVRTMWLDRPKVVLSGHFGNFELAAYLFGVFGFKLFSVARELDNPLLDRFVTDFRESRVQTILHNQRLCCSADRVFEHDSHRAGATGLFSPLNNPLLLHPLGEPLRGIGIKIKPRVEHDASVKTAPA